MSRVIYDNECLEYMEGWNANNAGKHFLSNPYSCLAFDGELYRLWQKGFNDSRDQWDNGAIKEPVNFTEQQLKDAHSIRMYRDIEDL